MAGRATLAGLISILALTACSRTANEARTTQDDMVAVARLMVTLDRVISEEDLAGLLALVAEDAVYMLPDTPALVGKRAIGEFYSALFTSSDIEIAHEVLEIDAAGKFVIHRGNAKGTTTPRTGGEPIEFDDKYLFLIKRAANGSLLVWRAVFNRNSPTSSSGSHP